MKKLNRIVLSLLLFAGFVSLIAIYFMSRDDKLDPALLLPIQTSLYLEHRDLDTSIDDFLTSQLGQTLSTIDYEMLFRELDIDESHYEMFTKIKSDISEFLDGPIFNQLLSKKVIFTILPVQGAEGGDPVTEIKSRILILLEPRLNSELVNLINFLNPGGEERTNVTYGNHVIVFHHLKNRGSLITTKVGKLFLLSFNEDLIRNCLDRFDQGDRSLLSNKDFQELRKKNSKSRVFFYGSIPSIRDQLPYFTQHLDKPNQQTFAEIMDEWAGWRTLSFGVRMDENTFYDEAVVYFDKDKMHPKSKKMFLTPPETNLTLSMVPPDVVTYYWTNTFDLPTIWDAIVNSAGTSQEQRTTIQREFTKNVGMKPEKLFDMFDNRLAFFVTESNIANFLPLPDISFIIQLKQPDRMSRVLKKRLKELAIPIQSQKYKKRKIVFWGDAIQQSFQPVYAISDGYLYISSSVKIMKKLLDTVDSGEGLNGSPGFVSMKDNYVKAKNNSISYVQFSSLMRLSKELVNWGGMIMGLQDRRVAYKSKILIEHLINPILDSMMMFSTVHARSYATNNKIVFESQTAFEKTTTKN